MKNIYEGIGADESVLSKLFRYAVIVKVFGTVLDNDTEVCRLSEKAVKDIRIDDYCEGTDGLAVLFGAGYIDEETFCRMIKNGMVYPEDIYAAEAEVIEQNGKADEDKLTSALIQNALLCTSYGRKYKEIQSVGFKEALTASGLPYVCLEKGLPVITDRDFFEFLAELDEPFGHIDKQGGVYIESKDNLVWEENREDAPFALNMRNLIYFSDVYGKPYGKDFIRYARENSIAADESFSEKYGEYLKKIKLHFMIKSYGRKRSVCGNCINWFDYASAAEGGITENMNADYQRDIDIEPAGDYSDEELTRKALDKFRSTYILEENTVIEVFHNSSELLFAVKDSKLITVDKEEFHTMLFDFDSIWGIIQQCSRNGEVKKTDAGIILPSNVWEEIPPQERRYAAALIKDQYERIQERRKPNKLLRTISQMREEAAAERLKNQQKLQKLDEKKKARGSGTEG